MEEKLNEQLSADLVTPAEVKPEAKPAKPSKAPTVKEQIQELVKEFETATTPADKLAAADLLVELRGKARKPWGAFGVSNDVVTRIATVRAMSQTPAEAKAKAEPVKKTAKAKVTKAPVAGKHADNLRSILNDTSYSDYQKGHALHDYKRHAKKSFDAMGLSLAEVATANKLVKAIQK